jgi:integrase
MIRPRTKAGAHLPPRMLARRRKRADGTEWVGYYYNAGGRKEISLGTDLVEAKRKWAELEGKPADPAVNTLAAAFAKYRTDVLPKKARKTQLLNEAELAVLAAYFAGAKFADVKTKHLAAYRDGRKTKRRLRKDGTVRDPGGKPAPVAANRELALFSDVWNYAREWGYTDLPNPCRGLRKNSETPRDNYVDDEVWQAVRAQGEQDLRDALDLAYLCGQRPDDVVSISERHIVGDALQVRQAKTKKFLSIQLTDASTGVRTELGQLIDTIRARPVRGLKLLLNMQGKPLTRPMLRTRFEDARNAARQAAEAAGNTELATRIKAFQFRDIRAKAASDIDSLEDASKLLGHTKEQITDTVYRRVGERVKPTK